MIDDLEQCEDGVWRTTSERISWMARRNRWIEPLHQCLTIGSLAAWFTIVGIIIIAFQ